MASYQQTSSGASFDIQLVYKLGEVTYRPFILWYAHSLCRFIPRLHNALKCHLRVFGEKTSRTTISCLRLSARCSLSFSLIIKQIAHMVEELLRCNK